MAQPLPLDDVREAALALSPRERLALADDLYASVEPDPAWEQAWSAELDRRAAEMDSGAVVGVPAAQVHAEARARLRAQSKP